MILYMTNAPNTITTSSAVTGMPTDIRLATVKTITNPARGLDI